MRKRERIYSPRSRGRKGLSEAKPIDSWDARKRGPQDGLHGQSKNSRVSTLTAPTLRDPHEFTIPRHVFAPLQAG